MGKTRAGSRKHVRNLSVPTDSFVSVNVRGRRIIVRNNKKVIDVWVKRQGKEGRETIQWVLNQLARDCHGEGAPSELPRDCKGEGAPSEGSPSDEDPLDRPHALVASPEEEHRKAIISELDRDPRCEKLIWLPSRAAFRIVIKGEEGEPPRKEEVKVKQYSKLKKVLDDGGTFKVLRERYDEAKDTLEEHLRKKDDRMDEDQQSEPRDADEHPQGPHAIDEGPLQDEPRDADEHLRGPHPPAPPRGASVDSDGDATDQSIPGLP